MLQTDYASLSSPWFCSAYVFLFVSFFLSSFLSDMCLKISVEQSREFTCLVLWVVLKSSKGINVERKKKKGMTTKNYNLWTKRWESIETVVKLFCNRCFNCNRSQMWWNSFVSCFWLTLKSGPKFWPGKVQSIAWLSSLGSREQTSAWLLL